MIGLSTKLNERMALNTGGSFPQFVSNIIIADDAIRAHKDAKKRKVVAALSSSAPPRTGWCTTTIPPTHLVSITTTSASSHSGFPAHLSASISRRHLGLYLHHRPCHTCLRHRPLEPPPAIPASTMAARATSRESAPCPRRTSLRATSPIHHVVRRRWMLPRPAASTTPLWKTFLRASQSSWVHFFLNGHSAVVLFDSGTTHDFVSKACTHKCKLVIELISAPYIISTPGGGGGRLPPSK
jgi:hypothetical protein